MNILVVVPALGRGGVERVVSLLGVEWARSGHAVLIARFDGSRESAWPVGWRIVDLEAPASRRTGRKLLNALLRARRLAALIRSERPDRIVAFTESANFASIAAAAAVGRLDRLSVSVHVDPAGKPPAHRLLIPLLYRLPARVVAVSAGVERALVSMGVPAARIRVIHNPAGRARDRPPPEPGAAALPPGRFVLGAGRLCAQKGFDRLLRAFARLGPAGDLRLAILGEGPARAELRRQARALGIGGRVHLPGWVNDLDRWYRAAECFVLSSRYEGFGLVLVEAMANRCPVVAFDCPFGPSEIVHDGRTGLLVAEGDVDALADAMSRLLADPDLRRRLAGAAEASLGAFALEALAARWID